MSNANDRNPAPGPNQPQNQTQNTAPKLDVKITKDEIVHCCTREYLDGLDPNNLPPLNELKHDLNVKTRNEIMVRNIGAAKNDQWRLPSDLLPYQIAMVIAHIEPVCCINCVGSGSDPVNDLLGVYQESGQSEGIYAVDDIAISSMIRKYCRSVTINQVKEIITILREIVPHKTRCSDPDLVAVNNGIFDYRTKKLMPFDRKYVFLSKSGVDYVPGAPSPVIHNADDGTDWDVDSWMSDLSEDPEIVQLLWEILGAIIRPNVHWDRSVWFYSTTGNNGKGTLCELMRQLCGPMSYASLSLSDFSKEFMLEPLVRVSAIITDENNVGEFIDKAANLKAITTGDVIQINRKYKPAITYRFTGFMVQCLNEMPRVKDKSDSFYRRQVFIPFDKTFTGRERKYIKADYLHRPEVLQYVLRKVLESDYYALSEPMRCKQAMAEYKDFNDPVRQFANEILPLCVWDLLPFTFLYDLYRAWMKRNSPAGGVQGRNTFINDLLSIMPALPEWECPDRRRSIRPQGKMDWPEPLISEYDLEMWSNPIKQPRGTPAYNTPSLHGTYSGLTRVTPRGPSGVLLPKNLISPAQGLVPPGN